MSDSFVLMMCSCDLFFVFYNIPVVGADVVISGAVALLLF